MVPTLKLGILSSGTSIIYRWALAEIPPGAGLFTRNTPFLREHINMHSFLIPGHADIYPIEVPEF
jgi:hypothetical protein